RTVAPGGDFTLGIHEACDFVLAATPQGVISMIDDNGERLLRSPGPLAHVAASPRSMYVVGATDGRLLLWDLDAIAPKHATAQRPRGAAFVTADIVIATFVDSEAQWIDLRDGKTHALGMVPGVLAVVPTPDGQRAVLIDSTQHARLVAAMGDPVELAGD